MSENQEMTSHASLASMHLRIPAVGLLKLAARKLLVREHEPKQKERSLFSLPQFIMLFEVAAVS